MIRAARIEYSEEVLEDHRMLVQMLRHRIVDA
jgi:hypothetical protein